MFDVKLLESVPRLLIEAGLRPVQGNRFQPTGFPDLGAATYTLPDGKEMLLVESPQSMANRLESTAWNPATNDLVDALKGLPYIAVVSPIGKFLTSSILEAHRVNSPYFLDSEGGKFLARLKTELEGYKGSDPEAVDLRHAARIIFKYDPNSVLHGIFLASKKLAGGRYRLARLLSSFVEANNVRPAESGGVKNDRVSPSGEGKAVSSEASLGGQVRGASKEVGLNAKAGYGNVPFHRTEYVASAITAYFNLDLATLRGYGLGKPAEQLLVALALWKIRYLLSRSLRLRTACDLVCDQTDRLTPTSPSDFRLPGIDELTAQMPELIGACKADFADPPITRLIWSAKEARKLAADRLKAEAEDEVEGK
jgi:CRISPR-associated protein Csb1